MTREASTPFHGRFAGLNLLLACLLTFAALLAAPSFAEAASGQITTINWRNGTAQGYEMEAVAVTTNVATVTLTGAGLPTTFVPMYPVSNEGGVTVYKARVDRGGSKPVVGAKYTIKIVYVDNVAPPEDLTVSVTGVLEKNTTTGVDNFPTMTAPLGAVASSAAPTFYWNPPPTFPAGGAYSLSLTGPDLFEWSTEVPSTETSTTYNGSTPLTPGSTYNWAVATMDVNGNKAEIRGGSFLLGTNFTGKATDINGLPLAGVQVRATEVGTATASEAVLTGTDGTYIFSGLLPGNYIVDFNLQTYFYKNRLDRADAVILPITGESVISNVNAVIGGWGAISGSVSLPGVRPASGVQIGLYDANKVAVTSVPAITIPLVEGFGSYYLSPVRPGSYFVKVAAEGYEVVWKPVTVTLNTKSTLWDILKNGVPVIKTFSVPPTSASLTVTGISVSASLFGGQITGYMLTETPTAPLASATGWSAAPPTSYTFATSGNKTLYAWAKGSTNLVSPSASAPVAVAVPTALTVQLVGNGTVNSNPAGIACATGSTAGCSKVFTAGSVVTLTAIPNSLTSVFGGWSGACTGTGSCVVTVNTAKSVTATFTAKPATVRVLSGATTRSYYRIGDALDSLATAAATATHTVQARGVDFMENVIMVSPVTISVKGGLTDAFTPSTTGRTKIDGSLKIRRGKLISERLAIK